MRKARQLGAGGRESSSITKGSSQRSAGASALQLNACGLGPPGSRFPTQERTDTPARIRRCWAYVGNAAVQVSCSVFRVPSAKGCHRGPTVGKVHQLRSAWLNRGSQRAKERSDVSPERSSSVSTMNACSVASLPSRRRRTSLYESYGFCPPASANTIWPTTVRTSPSV